MIHHPIVEDLLLNATPIRQSKITSGVLPGACAVVHQLDAADDCFNMHDVAFFHDLAIDLGSWSLQIRLLF